MSSTADLLGTQDIEGCAYPLAFGVHEKIDGVEHRPVYVNLGGGNREHGESVIKIGSVAPHESDWRAYPGLSNETLEGKSFAKDTEAALALYAWWKTWERAR